MTGRDLQVLFCTALQDAGFSPVVKSRTAFDYLDRSREEIISEMIKGVGVNQIVREGLQTLVRTVELETISKNARTSGVIEDYAELPVDHRYYLRAGAEVHWSFNTLANYTFQGSGLAGTGPGKRISNQTVPKMYVSEALVKLVELDDLQRLNQDPFNRTSIKEPLGYLHNNEIRVTTLSNFIVPKITLTYIKIPASLSRNVSVELPDNICRMIVDRAASLFLGERTRMASTPDPNN